LVQGIDDDINWMTWQIWREYRHFKHREVTSMVRAHPKFGLISAEFIGT
jgi:hypothetical protein